MLDKMGGWIDGSVGLVVVVDSWQPYLSYYAHILSFFLLTNQQHQLNQIHKDKK